jgi:hypothetical protein
MTSTPLKENPSFHAQIIPFTPKLVRKDGGSHADELGNLSVDQIFQHSSA